MLLRVADLLEEEIKDINQGQEVYENAYEDEEIHNILISELNKDFSFVIRSDLTFTKFSQDIDNGKFQLEDFQQGFRNLEQSSLTFENLFEDIDLYSKKLVSRSLPENPKTSFARFLSFCKFVFDTVILSVFMVTLSIFSDAIIISFTLEKSPILGSSFCKNS